MVVSALVGLFLSRLETIKIHAREFHDMERLPT